VSGVDFSEVAVEKCRRQGLDATVSDVDKAGLRFPDGTFDVVWASDVIELLPEPVFVLRSV
jgi:hypothetical protein